MESTAFLAKFAKNVRNLKIALSYLLNPFKDRTSELINTITNDIAGDGVADSMKLLETTGSGLESNYVTDVVSGENPITDPLKNVGCHLLLASTRKVAQVQSQSHFKTIHDGNNSRNPS